MDVWNEFGLKMLLVTVELRSPRQRLGERERERYSVRGRKGD